MKSIKIQSQSQTERVLNKKKTKNKIKQRHCQFQNEKNPNTPAFSPLLLAFAFSLALDINKGSSFLAETHCCYRGARWSWATWFIKPL